MIVSNLSKDAYYEEFDGRLVVVDFQKDKVYLFPEIETQIWKLIESGVDIENFESISSAIPKDDISAFIQLLLEKNILKKTDKI
ncbi:MAG: hypothetical protein IKT60_07030 [Clostridia bacterium]|nr:hypothetical protein [Clostridia bacterium]